MNTIRAFEVTETNETKRTKWAVCIDSSNSGQIERQSGKLYSTEKEAKDALRSMRVTGQVVRVPAKK